MRFCRISGLMLLLAGCGDPIHPRQVIEKPRVLGARAEVTGDAGRATPAPSESASVRWFVVDPLGEPDVGWSLVACEPLPVATGASRCGDHILASDVSERGTRRLPELQFSLPDDYRASSVLVAGAVCFGGTPPSTDELLRDWPRVTRCGAGRAQAVTFEVTVDHGGDRNRNPSLGGDPLNLHQATWPPLSSEVIEPCFDRQERADLPKVSSQEGAVRISYGPHATDRERLADGQGESLLMASFSNAGELERTFSVIEWETSPQGSVELEWVPSGKIPPGGKIVTFYFVLRDSRGGSDWTERSLCLGR